MPKIGYSANGFGKAMEASVEAVDVVEADGGGRGLEEGLRDGLRRVPVATVLANGAGEMQCVALAPQMLLQMPFDFCCKNGSG